ncbi:MAG: copper-translocating P-type ATPase, partial [Clostridia bacterium]|nr:copper-translocating P-type ATPase [Clostridia bacterium]
MKQYTVTGMSCAACQARVEKAVSAVEGVTACSVSLLTNSMGVEGDVSPELVIKAVEKAGYGASVKGEKKQDSPDEDALKDTETPVLKRRLILSVGFLIVLMYITMGHNMWSWPLPAYFEHNHLGLSLTQMLIALIVMLINKKFFVSGFKAVLHRAPNMDTLVALGSGVSFAWSLYALFKMCGMITRGADNMALMEIYHNELYFESAAMIPALITVGKLLEALSKGRTTNALKALMKLSPKTAVVLKDGKELSVPVDEVKSGDLFVLRPGDSVPVDGEVIEGESAVNESALTGESIPVDKAAGDRVSAATINQSGYLKCRATRVGEDTTISQIIRMVSDAAATKAPIARIADKVSGIFVPAVIGIALLVVLIWLLIGQTLPYALARGISVLVISCPCALGLATPVAIMVGNGVGAKQGILFKTSAALEELGRVKLIALDKTGTITEGTPRVTDVVPFAGVEKEELLRKAASLEQKSEHPLAKAVLAHAQDMGLMPQEIESFRALPGSGVEGRLMGKSLLGGSARFMRSRLALSDDTLSRIDALSQQGKTPLLFAEDDRLLGILAVADAIKADSAQAIASLKKLGLHTVMLTGDNPLTAKAIAAQAGVDEVAAGVLPDGKAQVIEELKAFGKTAMVGDGINDAPALTRADTGIAIGAGADVAIDSADVVLMNSSLTDVVAAVRLSRGTLRNIHENLFWAFFYNLI